MSGGDAEQAKDGQKLNKSYSFDDIFNVNPQCFNNLTEYDLPARNIFYSRVCIKSQRPIFVYCLGFHSASQATRWWPGGSARSTWRNSKTLNGTLMRSVMTSCWSTGWPEGSWSRHTTPGSGVAQTLIQKQGGGVPQLPVRTRSRLRPGWLQSWRSVGGRGWRAAQFLCRGFPSRMRHKEQTHPQVRSLSKHD